ncbi:MAG: HEAT repeat domain-containing protein [Candidatus Zipacnadales bacterium]
MRVYLMLIVVPLSLIPSSAHAHLCNNIYRTPDRIIVKPERNTTTLETNDTLRIFVRNNYPTMLRNLRLIGQTDTVGVQVAITPDHIDLLKPGQKEAFTVRLTAAPETPPGSHSLKLSILADNIGWNNVGSQPVAPVSDAELIRALGDGNPSCEVLAAESLARRGNNAGVDYLKNAIERGDRRGIRAAGRSGNSSLVPSLVSKLGVRNGFVVGTTCLALGLLKTELDKVSLLCGSADPFVATAAHAALMLAEQGTESHLGFLREKLNYPDPWVRCAAAWGCAWANEAQALRVLDEILSQGNAELVVFAGDALVTLAERQEGQTANQASSVQVTPTSTTSGQSAFKASTADRLAVKPRLPLPNCAKGAPIEVQLYHSYPGPFHHIRVEVNGEGVLTTQPAVLEALKPTQIASVRLGIQVAAPGDADLVAATLVVTADELEQPARFAITLPCTETGVQELVAQQATPVGEIGVHIMRFGDYYLLLFGVPLAVILGMLGWRYWKQQRPQVLVP